MRWLTRPLAALAAWAIEALIIAAGLVVVLVGGLVAFVGAVIWTLIHGFPKSGGEPRQSPHGQAS